MLGTSGLFEVERPRLTAMGSCCGCPAPLPACTSSSTDVSLSLVRLAGVESLMALSMKKSPCTCGASTPMPAQNPGCGTDHWAGVTMRMLSLQYWVFLHRKRQGAGVVYFKTKLWVAGPSTANAPSVACHPSPAKSSVVNPSIASFLVTQLPTLCFILHCRCCEWFLTLLKSQSLQASSKSSRLYPR